MYPSHSSESSMEPECKGQLHGHDFPYVGAKCSRCAVGQKDLSSDGSNTPRVPTLSNPFSRAVPTRRVKARGLHSEIHLFVSEIRRTFGETASKGKGSFGFYLGFVNRLGLETARLFYAEAKDRGNSGRYFWWRVGDYFKKKREKKISPDIR